jgi:hypothetical protein
MTLRNQVKCCFAGEKTTYNWNIVESGVKYHNPNPSIALAKKGYHFVQYKGNNFHKKQIILESNLEIRIHNISGDRQIA